MNEEEKEEKKLWQKATKAEGEERVEALIKLSYSAYGKGNHRESLTLCETARDVYESMGAAASSMTLAHIYYGIAWSLNKLEQHQEAVNAMDKSLSLYREMGSVEVVNALKSEGDFWFEAKEYEKAQAIYISITTEGNPDIKDEDLVWAYDSSAQAFESLKKWNQALEHFKIAREMYKKLKNPRGVVHVDEEISICHYWLGNGIDAEVHAKLALDFAELSEDLFHTAWAKSRLAMAYKLQGRVDDAIKEFTEAKSIFTGANQPDWVVIAKIDQKLGELFTLKGDIETSEIYKRRSKSLLEIVGEPEDLIED